MLYQTIIEIPGMVGVAFAIVALVVILQYAAAVPTALATVSWNG